VLLSDPPRLRIPPLEAGAARAVEPGPEGWPTLEEVDRRYVRRVIEQACGRVTGPGGVAEILGLNPSTASWRSARLGLKPDLLRARRA
jgi:formate hydrogenlyase transcriptional activator